MKRIVAIIRPEKFEDVKKALDKEGFNGLNITEVKGRGRQKGTQEKYRGSNYCIDLIPKIRLEVILKEGQLDKAINIILENAKTGEEGDGKIFVSPVHEVIRIRTGETHYDAID